MTFLCDSSCRQGIITICLATNGRYTGKSITSINDTWQGNVASPLEICIMLRSKACLHAFPKSDNKRGTSRRAYAGVMTRPWTRVMTVVSITVVFTCLLYVWSSATADDLVTVRRLPGTPLVCPELHFSRRGLPVTVLASFPGSGNTWLRHLLQQATGETHFLSIVRNRHIMFLIAKRRECINAMHRGIECRRNYNT